MQPTDDLPVDVWRRVPGDGGAVAFGWLCGQGDRRVLVAHCDGALSVDGFSTSCRPWPTIRKSGL